MYVYCTMHEQDQRESVLLFHIVYFKGASVLYWGKYSTLDNRQVTVSIDY